ncbi:hypothetical protein [Pontiella agarivorans]|uniref:Uncharacterized protein n=1 Tax=Pontiella agarivorans TaxID=3038953 RepID=A0ABU5N1B0_9BACT|nr:hypothetical protein [Pontiella agarivorans]MDZ8120230.1 hypothetical protein [Pontiella agarivorans]
MDGKVGFENLAGFDSVVSGGVGLEGDLVAAGIDPCRGIASFVAKENASFSATVYPVWLAASRSGTSVMIAFCAEVPVGRSNGCDRIVFESAVPDAGVVDAIGRISIDVVDQDKVCCGMGFFVLQFLGPCIARGS